MKPIAKTLSLLLAGAIFAITPSLAQEVNTDYDHSFAFNKIKTYSYAKVGSSDPQITPRMTAAIDHILQGQGLHLVSKNPDVLISAADFTKRVGEYSTFYRGLTGYDWKRGWGNGGFAAEESSLREIPLGTFVVDMYVPGGKLVWRGVATEEPQTNERKTEDNIDKATNEMFTKFPPKSGGPVAANQVSVPASTSGETPTGTR